MIYIHYEWIRLTLVKSETVFDPYLVMRFMKSIFACAVSDDVKDILVAFNSIT